MTSELEAGRIVGGYELERRIGKGGMAEVWVARKARSRAGKFVAVKVILPHLAEQERYSRMFQREAELSSLLSHSNIVQVFDEGDDQGISYLVMEYVDGVNLVRVREAMATIPDPAARESVAAHLVGQLLHALSYAHSITTHEGEALAIVHRDVSPQNVLVSNSGDVKLTDFGVAHTVIEESSGIHIKGKLRYMAPEQLGGKTKDPTIDLFAVGAILHELLDGQKFRGEFDDDRVLYSQILSGVVPKLRTPCSPELERVRCALLAGNPAQRVQTADQALAMLREFRGYRDMRLEVSRLCSGVTGVARPRTGPGQGRAPSNPSATASRSIAPSYDAGPPSMAGPAPITNAGPPHPPVEPTAYLQGGGLPPVAAPAEPTAYLDSGPMPAAPAPERTAYLDGGGLPQAARHAYGESGPQHVMPYAESGPQAVRDATNTENRPRPTTIPDGVMMADGEVSMTRFGAPPKRTGLTIAALVGGIVLALGGAVATGFVLTRGDTDEPAETASLEAAQAKTKQPAPAAAAKPEPAEADEPGLVIGEPAPAPELEPDADDAAEPEPEPAPAPDPAPEPEAEPEPEAKPEAEPAKPNPEPDPDPDQATTKRRSKGGKRSDRSSAPAQPSVPVLVHFRKENVPEAWAKVAGKAVQIGESTSRNLPSGSHRVSMKTTADGKFKACGRHNFSPGHEWVVRVSGTGCRFRPLGG